MQHGQNDRTDHHEDGVEDVDGSDDTRPLVGVGPSLHRAERRHDEQAAGNRQPGKVDRDMADILCGAAKNSPMLSGFVAATITEVMSSGEIERKQAKQYTANQRRQQHDASVGEPCAARPEPSATAIEKMVRKMVTTPSLPPMLKVASGGNSESTSAPTSQNQLDTIAPHHKRGSPRIYLMSAQVEAKTLPVFLTTSVRRALPVGGMNRLAIQHATDSVTIISQAK